MRRLAELHAAARGVEEAGAAGSPQVFAACARQPIAAELLRTRMAELALEERTISWQTSGGTCGLSPIA